MSQPFDRTHMDGKKDALIDELTRTQMRLSAELAALKNRNEALAKQLGQATTAGAVDRESRRAALNSLDDVVRASTETRAVNAELQRRIDERQCAEVALRDAEARLTEAQRQFNQLQTEFNDRVRARTDKLERREERLRDLATLLKRSEQRERQRLARLLHDHVQQLLVAAKMRIDIVSCDMSPSLRSGLTQAIEVLNSAIQATRDLSVQLTPPLLHDQGLSAALEWLTSRMARQNEQQITTHFDKSADPPDQEEREVLFQAAQEFLLNSAKHGQSDRIACRLTRGPLWIRLEVEDAGRGFDSTQHVEEGSFGLFQIRQRLESIGGILTIRSAPNQGTIAAAIIPADRGATSSPLQISPTLPLLEIPRRSAGPITVVVIDDHQPIREQMMKLLRRHADIKVVGEAADGYEGVRVVFAMRPDAVIMDINMPVMSGIEATRRIMAQLPGTKIIGLSIDEAEETSNLIRDAGATAFVSKAAAASEFIQAIRTAVGSIDAR